MRFFKNPKLTKNNEEKNSFDRVQSAMVKNIENIILFLKVQEPRRTFRMDEFLVK